MYVYSCMYIYFYIIILFIYFSFFLEDTPKYRDNVEIIRNNIEIVCGTATGFLFFFIPFFLVSIISVWFLIFLKYYIIIWYMREREKERDSSLCEKVLLLF